MMYILENEKIRAEFSATGAELQKLYHKEFALDYIWDGDPKFWAKHSPVLFPIVGTLKENTYYVQGKPYTLGRHGFAREKEFAVESRSEQEIVFLLQSDAETKKVYPFEFEFRVRYTLRGSEFATEYLVKNPGQTPLLFSVGGHPAFRLPLTPGTAYSDYYLQFEEPENLARWPITADGLIGIQPIPLLNETDRLNLVPALFYQDAIVFKYPRSSELSIRSGKTPHGLTMDMGEFPYLGIWSFRDADFLCLEPWCGIADSENTDQQLERKEGIEKTAPGATFSRQWRITLF